MTLNWLALPSPAPRKLHSIPGTLLDTAFEGQIAAAVGRPYVFSFQPRLVDLTQDQIEVTGTLRVSRGAEDAREQRDVCAILAGSQGGILYPPTSELEGKDGESMPEEWRGAAKNPGASEATGDRWFLAALYMKMPPLDEAALRLPFDVSAVQLNGRLAPVTARGRRLTRLLADLLRAMHEDRAAESIPALLAEINQLFAPST